MNKQEYVKQLLSRLSYMISENEKASKIYKQLESKLPAYEPDHEAYWAALRRLQEKEYEIWKKDGIVYSKSALQRIRIELNTVLIELEKENNTK
jgi:hypothetical protein